MMIDIRVITRSLKIIVKTERICNVVIHFYHTVLLKLNLKRKVVNSTYTNEYKFFIYSYNIYIHIYII